jgi:hypothetical protein
MVKAPAATPSCTLAPDKELFKVSEPLLRLMLACSAAVTSPTARLRALLRRTGPEEPTDAAVMTFGDLTLDPATREVHRGKRAISLTLTEGKYHQVKRMLAAVGHKVVGLHRAQMGGLQLPPDLAAGQWRWLSPADLALLR